MKKFRSFIILIAVILVCAGSVWLTLKATAEYPSFSDIAVTYPVNQVDGFELTIEKPSFSPSQDIQSDGK